MTTSQWWSGPVDAEPDFEQLLKVLRCEARQMPTGIGTLSGFVDKYL